MSLLSLVMLCIFVVAWCVAVGAWFYAARFLIPWWLAGVAALFGFRWRYKREGYLRKAAKGAGVFVAAVVTGLIAGGIAAHWGGGWQ